LSPIPLTTLAFAIPELFIAAAIVSGETEAALLASGYTCANTNTVVEPSALP
jgi:hypothetical protein